MVSDILLINTPTFLVSIFVMRALFIKKSPYFKTVTLGLCIIIFSGIASVPFVEWLLENHRDWVHSSTYNLALSTVPMGIITAIGIYICVSPLLKRGMDA